MDLGKVRPNVVDILGGLLTRSASSGERLDALAVLNPTGTLLSLDRDIF